MMPRWKIYLADLTHTAQGVSANTFPLGVAFLLSYARSQLDAGFEFVLFKFPQDLERALRADPPSILCLSNYSWNFELAYKIAGLAKLHYPALITVFGGPNFPTVSEEKAAFLRTHRAIDFYVELEGEMGFVDLVHCLEDHGFAEAKLKAQAVEPLNTAYLAGDCLVSGRSERILNVESIPSPYLSGLLDEFFRRPLVPMIETTRGCPFACTFCADGLSIKNRVTRFPADRIREELYYIAKHVRNVDELIITDLNFAMYEQDLETARTIAQMRDELGWPTLISASAGKNRPQRTIEAASVLKGAWTLGASIQSTDEEVLVAVKRKNISSGAYKNLIEYGNSLENSKTHSEIILGLPGDTRDKHFESLRFGVDNGVTAMRMFQAMLLRGTEMADRQTRARYGLLTKFRTIPGCVGEYELFGARHAVSEIEEIIVGSDSLSFAEYLDCRVMNLFVETFYNNALFEEVFSLCRALDVSVFDCLLQLKAQPDRYTARIRAIIDAFVFHTGSDLFDSFEQARDHVLTPEVIEQYVGGELGINELLIHKALLFREFDDISTLIFTTVREILRRRNLLAPCVGDYLDELYRYTLLRKRDCVADTDAIYHAPFKYDLEQARHAGYRVDPAALTVNDPPIEMMFFHTVEQKAHIAHQLSLYANTPIGLGRLIQRSNLKLMYRSVRPVASAAAH